MEGGTNTSAVGTTLATVLSVLAVVGFAIVLIDSLTTSENTSSGGETGQDQVSAAPASADISSDGPWCNGRRRRPSATTAVVLVTQLQLLAVLSLVESVVGTGSWLSDFVVGLRWVNLWWPAPFAEDILPEECSSTTGESEIGPANFVGNLTLVVGIFFGICFLHIVVLSAVEACWLRNAGGEAQVRHAQHVGEPVGVLPELRGENKKFRHQIAPYTSNGGGSYSSPVTRRSLETGEESGQMPEDDEKQEEPPVVEMHGQWSVHTLTPIEQCRHMSRAAWLHFPHVELIFLLFAFGGAVASQLAVIRQRACVGLYVVAIAALVLFPTMLFLAVWRVIHVRVRSRNSTLDFHPVSSGDGCEGSRGSERRAFLDLFRTSWRGNCSLFSWADKGQWGQAVTDGQEPRPDEDWFRIGFEPVFVDFSKTESWVFLVTLVERAAIACAGVLVDDSVKQLLGLCVLSFMRLVLLLMLKPFANRIVNAIGACLATINAISMAALGVSAMWEDGSAAGATVNDDVMIVQTITLCLLVVPVLMEAMVIAHGVSRSILAKVAHNAKVRNEEEREIQHVIQSYTLHFGVSTCCTILLHNISAFAQDIRRGLHRAPGIISVTESPPPHVPGDVARVIDYTPEEVLIEPFHMGAGGATSCRTAHVQIARVTDGVEYYEKTDSGRNWSLNSSGRFVPRSQPSHASSAPMPQGSESTTNAAAGVDGETTAVRRTEGVVGGTSYGLPYRPQSLDHRSSGRQLVSRGVFEAEVEDVDNLSRGYTVFSSCPARLEAVLDVAEYRSPTASVAFPWRGSLLMSSSGAATSQVEPDRHNLALDVDDRARQNNAKLSAPSVVLKRRFDANGVKPAAGEIVDNSNARLIWPSGTTKGVEDVAVSGSSSATGHSGSTPALESKGGPPCHTNRVNCGDPSTLSTNNGEVRKTHDLDQTPCANDVSCATDSSAGNVKSTTGIERGDMISNGRRIEWLEDIEGSSGKHRLIHRSYSEECTDQEGFTTPPSTEEGSSNGGESSASSARRSSPWRLTPGCRSYSFESAPDEKGDMSVGRPSSIPYYVDYSDVSAGGGHLAVNAPEQGRETDPDMRRLRWQEATGINASGRGLMY